MEQSGRFQWDALCHGLCLLGRMPWCIPPGSCTRGFPTVDRTPVKSWGEDFPGHSCTTATRTGCSLLAAACFVTNIMLCSPSSPCVLFTGKSLQAIIPGLFSPADSGDGQCDRCAGGGEKECGVHNPASHPRKLICSTYGPLSAGQEALFWAALSVSFTSACNISNSLIYCNSSGKQLL